MLDGLEPSVRIRCPRGHEIDGAQTMMGWDRIRCPCGLLFEYLGDVKCARSNNKTKKLPGKKRRFDVETTLTVRTPAGGSEQQRIVLHGMQSEPRELVHLRAGHRMSCSRGRTGVYHVVNYTIGEQWNLLRRFSWWMVGLRLVPILLVASLTADVAQDSFHASTGGSVLWTVIAGLLTATVLAVRYGRRHAVPLWRRRSSAVEKPDSSVAWQ